MYNVRHGAYSILHYKAAFTPDTCRRTQVSRTSNLYPIIQVYTCRRDDNFVADTVYNVMLTATRDTSAYKCVQLVPRATCIKCKRDIIEQNQFCMATFSIAFTLSRKLHYQISDFIRVSRPQLKTAEPRRSIFRKAQLQVSLSHLFAVAKYIYAQLTHGQYFFFKKCEISGLTSHSLQTSVEILHMTAVL